MESLNSYYIVFIHQDIYLSITFQDKYACGYTVNIFNEQLLNE